MKLLDKNGFNILLDNNAILFQINKDKYIKHYITSIEEINYNYYLKIKLGNEYKKIVQNFGCEKINDTKSIILQDHSVILSFYQESIIYKYDKYGELLWKNGDAGKYDTIYDIEIDKNSIWCAYPTSNTIKKFTLDIFKEETSIGGWDEKIFSFPESIRKYDDYLYICDMGNKRICQMNLNSFEMKEYLRFDEPVWEYIRFDNKEIVQLDSGIYLL